MRAFTNNGSQWKEKHLRVRPIQAAKKGHLAEAGSVTQGLQTPLLRAVSGLSCVLRRCNQVEIGHDQGRDPRGELSLFTTKPAVPPLSLFARCVGLLEDRGGGREGRGTQYVVFCF